MILISSPQCAPGSSSLAQQIPLYILSGMGKAGIGRFIPSFFAKERDYFSRLPEMTICWT